jgi:DNA-binding transcriptional LysR family regulator
LVAIATPDHVIANHDSVRLNELLSFPFICREEGSGTRDVINSYVKDLDFDGYGLNISMELGSPESVKGAVEAGMGISIISKATIQKELRLGTLVAVPLDPILERPFSFVHQKQKFRQRVMDELLEFARVYCEENQPN